MEGGCRVVATCCAKCSPLSYESFEPSEEDILSPPKCYCGWKAHKKHKDRVVKGIWYFMDNKRFCYYKDPSQFIVIDTVSRTHIKLPEGFYAERGYCISQSGTYFLAVDSQKIKVYKLGWRKKPETSEVLEELEMPDKIHCVCDTNCLEPLAVNDLGTIAWRHNLDSNRIIFTSKAGGYLGAAEGASYCRLLADSNCAVVKTRPGEVRVFDILRQRETARVPLARWAIPVHPAGGFLLAKKFSDLIAVPVTAGRLAQAEESAAREAVSSLRGGGAEGGEGGSGVALPLVVLDCFIVEDARIIALRHCEEAKK